MNGLIRLWAKNLCVTVVQSAIGAGIFFALPYSRNPEVAAQTPMENVVYALILLTLLTVLALLLSTFSALEDKQEKKGVVPALYVLGPSVFALFCTSTLTAALVHVEWNWALWYSGSTSEITAAWIAGWSQFTGIGYLGIVLSLAFFFGSYGTISAFVGIGSIVIMMKIAREDPENRASPWAYAITALPFGVGVVGFPLLLLAHKLLPSR